VLILGLDPGSLHTGYGLVERHGSSLLPIEAGRFSCPKDLALPERLAHLAARGEGWASDATDALAVAICCAQRLRLDRLADPGRTAR
jgi:Holliday junction resolvasome RuvABC endonuclease subunit